MDQSQMPNYGTQAPNSNNMHVDAARTVASMRDAGVSNAAIYDVLMKKGIDPVTAQQMINSSMAGGPAYKSSSRAEGQKDMLIGGLWFGAGLVITIGTYMAASESGGHYFITYGPVIYGLIRFFRGVSKL